MIFPSSCARCTNVSCWQLSLELLDEGQVLVDVVGGADHEGHPLVERLGLDVQYPLGASGGQASRLLDEEGDGVALVQQPQLWAESFKGKTRFKDFSSGILASQLSSTSGLIAATQRHTKKRQQFTWFHFPVGTNQTRLNLAEV